MEDDALRPKLRIVRPSETIRVGTPKPVREGAAPPYRKCRLSDLFEIIRGISLTGAQNVGYPTSKDGYRTNLNLAAPKVENRIGQRVIRGYDLDLPETLLPEFYFNEQVADRLRAKEGDLLLDFSDGTNPDRIDYPIDFPQQPRLVDKQFAGAVLADSVVALRPRSDPMAARAARDLTSNRSGLNRLGTESSGVDPDELSDLVVPVFSENVTELLKQSLWEQLTVDLPLSIEEKQNAVVEAAIVDNRTEFDFSLQKLNTTVRAVQEAMRASEDPEYQIRNLYPFPLAFPYRLLTGIPDPWERLHRQSQMAEKILAFVCSVTLALTGVRPLAELDKRGLSLGDWRDIGHKYAQSLADEETPALATALKSLWRPRKNKSASFFSRAEKLVKIRNEYSHRDPSVEKASQEASELIKDCMLDLAFFIQYPARLVTKLDSDREGRMIVHTLRYTGDHPAVPQEQAFCSEPFKTKDLYIEVAPSIWRPLFPFVTARHCEKCNNRELFFVQGFDRERKKVQFVSFESGHAPKGEDPEVVEALESAIGPRPTDS